MKMRLSDPQRRLLSKLPKYFLISEDHAPTVSITTVKDSDGNELMKLTTHEVRTFRSLERSGHIVMLDVLDETFPKITPSRSTSRSSTSTRARWRPSPPTCAWRG